MNIFEQAKNITNDFFIENTHKEMRSNTWLQSLQEGDQNNQQGNQQGGQQDDQNQSNQNSNEKDNEWITACKAYLKNNKDKALIVPSTWNNREPGFNIISYCIYTDDGVNANMIQCDIGTYNKAVRFKDLGVPPPGDPTDPVMVDMMKKYKGVHVKEITRKQVEILKQKGYTAVKEDLNIKTIQDTIKDMNDKEGIIFESLSRLYNDMIQTQGSGRLGTFNAG